MPGILAEAASLTLGLHEAENVVLANGTFDVTDDRTGFVVDELNTDLGDTTTGASAAEDLGNLSELRGVLAVHLFDLCQTTVIT